MQGVVVRHPLLCRLTPPGGVQAEKAGGEDAQLEKDDSSTGGDDDRPSGTDNLSILVASADENCKVKIDKIFMV